MKRIVFGLLLSMVLWGITLISYGFGDTTYTVETWIGSFILPIWSLATISFWYDLGRFIWTDTFELDSPNSTVSNDIRSFVFILWMSFVFTYIFWVHSSLFAIPLLLVLPLLGVPFRDFLLHDWTVIPRFTREQLIGLAFWACSSYLVYWLLTIAWILIRVWCIDTIDGGIVYFIK